MLRPLALLFALALPAFAAPVPKALKSKTPAMAGTRWVCIYDIAGSMYTMEWQFKEAGVLTVVHKGEESGGRPIWVQDGDTLTVSMNEGDIRCTLTYKDGAFEGSGANGSILEKKTWTVTLTPAEK